jgi:Flp pilus assembly protein TadG
MNCRSRTSPIKDAPHRNRRKQRGAVTLEAIAVLPPLLILFLAVLEFGIAILTQQAVTSASLEGVRTAARENATTNGVAADVLQFLAVHEVSFNTTGTNVVDDARVVIEVGAAGPVGLAGERGNTTLPCTPNGGALASNQVRVTVCVRMTNGVNQPVPDWLSTFGFSTVGRNIEVSSLTTFE